MAQEMLPPTGWLRAREWGRDLVSFTREEYSRIKEIEGISEMLDLDRSLSDAVVSYHKMMRAMTGENGGRLLSNVTYERAFTSICSKNNEIETAEMLLDYLDDGSKIIAVAPDLAATFKARDASTILCGDLASPIRSFYVTFDEPEGFDLEGRPLDGFFVTFERYETDGTPGMFVLPMSRAIPDEGQPTAPYPMIRLAIGDATETLTSAMRRESERMLQDAREMMNWEPSLDAEGSRKLAVMDEARKTILPIHHDLMTKASEMLSQQADHWATLLMGAVECIADSAIEGRPGYPVGAPDELVQRAVAGGTGARKAEQKLTANGYPRLLRYDVWKEPAADGGLSPKKVSKPAADPAEPTLFEPAPKKTGPGLKRVARGKTAKPVKEVREDTDIEPPRRPAKDRPVENRGKRRKREREEARRAGSSVTTEADDDDLLGIVDETIHACLKDLPALDARNWEAAFPPALASMIMRRTKVEQAPRETTDATRRRIAADILPRLTGLPENLAHLRMEETGHPGLRRAFGIGRPSVPRDMDPEVASEATHPFYVVVGEDDEIAPRLLFPGVEGTSLHKDRRRTIIRAWREDQILHLHGIVHQGCLIGFRRIEVALEDGTVTAFDSDADAQDPSELLDMLYAPVADAILGPVDEADAWLYAPRRSTKKHVVRDEPAAPADAARAEAVEPPAEPSGPAPVSHGNPFANWRSLSSHWDESPLSPGAEAVLREMLERNAVTRALLTAVDAKPEPADEEPDDVIPGILRAVIRHGASLATTDEPRIRTLMSPEIDDADLAPVDDIDGLIVLTDRAAFEHMPQGQVPGHQPLRERPMVVMYRIRREGLTALLVQTNPQSEITYAEWAAIPLTPSEEEDDLSWYLRGIVAKALDAEDASSPIAAQENSRPTLPGGVRTVTGKSRQGPRRVIAQVRLRPTNVAIAIAVVTEWFDEQVARHGGNVVEDRREAGEWTLEHRSTERGIQTNWSVTVRMPDDQPGAIDVIVRTTLATGVKPRLPTLVRDIAAATPTDGPDGRLMVTPASVKSRMEVLDLIRQLQSPDRVLPVLLMTETRDGYYARPPQDVARQALGALTVRTISWDMTYDLTDALGQEYRTFGGAVRIFQPRFDPDLDAAIRHPRIMNDASAERQISEIINRATAATVTRYDIPDVFRPHAPAAPVEKAQIGKAAEPIAQEEVARDEPTLPFEEEASAIVAETHTPTAPIVVATDTPLPAVDVPAPVDEPAISEPEDSDPPTDIPATGSPPIEEEAETREPSSAPNTTLEDIRRIVDDSLSTRLDNLGLAPVLGRITEFMQRMETAIITPPRIQDGDLLAEREAEIAALKDELRVERESMNQLIDEADAERSAANAQVAVLRQALNDRRRAGKSEAMTWPADLSGLSDWLERNVLPNVVVSSKAWREMRRVRYTDMERLCRTLQLLDGPYVDMRAGEEGARERWEEGLKELRLASKPQSKEGMGVRQSDYHFRHNGKAYAMERHIRGTESIHNDHERLLRIYFTFDKEERIVIIGHMPTHLTTIDS